jgi:hypothetical protein
MCVARGARVHQEHAELCIRVHIHNHTCIPTTTHAYPQSHTHTHNRTCIPTITHAHAQSHTHTHNAHAYPQLHPGWCKAHWLFLAFSFAQGTRHASPPREYLTPGARLTSRVKSQYLHIRNHVLRLAEKNLCFDSMKS